MSKKLTELSNEQLELVIVGMEMVAEEFSGNQQCSATHFELMPCQIYDYCDEIWGADSQNIREKYNVKTKRPNMRDTLTLQLSRENEELKRIAETLTDKNWTHEHDEALTELEKIQRK